MGTSTDPQELDSETIEKIYVLLRWLVFPKNNLHPPEKRLWKLPIKVKVLDAILHKNFLAIIGNHLGFEEQSKPLPVRLSKWVFAFSQSGTHTGSIGKWVVESSVVFGRNEELQ